MSCSSLFLIAYLVVVAYVGLVEAPRERKKFWKAWNDAWKTFYEK